jgi:hypothetical protein
LVERRRERQYRWMIVDGMMQLWMRQRIFWMLYEWHAHSLDIRIVRKYKQKSKTHIDVAAM